MTVHAGGGALGPEDEALLQRLRSVVRAVDPPPELVRELGRAAFGLRSLDAELAALVTDSAEEELVGVRSTATGRLLVFETADASIEVEVSATADGTLLLVGQVVPGSGGQTVRLERRDGGSTSGPLGDVGTFRFADVAPGAVRLHVERTGAEPLTTSWVHL